MEGQYLDLLRKALAGNKRTGRNGQTRAVFAAQLRHDMSEGFPLLTTKQMAWKTILAELLWFVEAGRDSEVPYRLSNVRLREIQGAAAGSWTIWTQDSEKAKWVAEGARFEGDCGRIYGAQWRNWNGEVDQLAKLVESIRNDPSSRYHKVVAWNPGELPEMCLPPCHGDFQCFVDFEGDRKFLSLHMNQRSCDLFLGVPFNIASYGFFLLMLAQVTDTTARELVLTLNDAHIYEGHVEAVETQLARAPLAPPRVTLDSSIKSIDNFRVEHFTVHGYESHPRIKADLY